MAVSIIIPTLNEAAHLAATLARTPSAALREVIVVDGGSTDGTVELALAAGARVLLTRANRACQMNTGARNATGNTLLFLHADTLLPPDYAEHIERTLTQPDTLAGAFQFRVDGPQRGLRSIEMMTNWRARVLQMPYGDQAIFMRAAVFHRAGGFPALPFMEDFELMRRLRRQGRIGIAPAAVITSARRWLKLGVLKTTLLNQAIITGYLLGVSPARLACWYKGRRPAQMVATAPQCNRKVSAEQLPVLCCDTRKE
ncbi:MAG TPA: TIGR04283 family arsenosugar biosynthesis glycosyltransferase [Blastocatellia bacterium]|nr:TIGR04283 family arsenosugar biosynthesis glycosyltransferase [Blastocatellia bacterium]